MTVLLVASVGFLAIVLYLIHVNRALTRIPPEIHELSPPEDHWTVDQIRSTYDRICKKPIDTATALPPRQQRRYIVVGGSGLVGGTIVSQLVARGQPTKSIRIIDFRRPIPEHGVNPEIQKVEFVQADITSESSTKAAFSAPWSPNVSSLPLTVFHTAAAIRPWERFKITLTRSTRVNVLGTANVLSAAKSSGADIFIATSSGSISIRPCSFWIWPWETYPRNYVQVFPDPDEDTTLRPREDYFANYALAKAQAEALVLSANNTIISTTSKSRLRTGTIRPCAGVYGSKYDLIFGSFMLRGHVETWLMNKIQPVVSASNVAISHLDYEAALLKSPETTSGKAFNISDPNPAIGFSDIYLLMETIVPSFKITYIQPIFLMPFAYIIEAYCTVVNYFTFLQKVGLREPTGFTIMLQPSVFSCNTNYQFYSDKKARLSLEEGGIGYTGVGTTLERMCDQVRKHFEDMEREVREGTAEKIEIKK